MVSPPPPPPPDQQWPRAEAAARTDRGRTRGGGRGRARGSQQHGGGGPRSLRPRRSRDHRAQPHPSLCQRGPEMASSVRAPDQQQQQQQHPPCPIPGAASPDERLRGRPVPHPESEVAGNYVVGPKVGVSPVASLGQHLGRRRTQEEECFSAEEDGSPPFSGGVGREHFLLKMLVMSSDLRFETQDERNGKMLLHTENSLLSLLEGERGVVARKDFFTEMCAEKEMKHGKLVFTGRRRKRVVLVLDKLAAVDQSPSPPDDPSNASRARSLVGDHVCAEHATLQSHVIRQRRLDERQAITIFYHVVEVVSRIHARNIVHRDLKLGNFVLNRRSACVTLTNFCLGRLVMGDADCLYDQRGSPAYISPEVLRGTPYRPKPSDMWALGVVLYTMLYGQFPFYDQSPNELFQKIKSVSYTLPESGDYSRRVSEETKNLIRKLFVDNEHERLTAPQLLGAVADVVFQWRYVQPSSPGSGGGGSDSPQVVPEFDPSAKKKEEEEKKRASSSSSSRRGGVSEAQVMLNWVRINSLRDQDEADRRDREAEEEEEEETLRLRRRGFVGIPTTRIMQDARELTNEEFRLYGDLIGQLRQNVPGSVSTTGQLIARRHSSSAAGRGVGGGEGDAGDRGVPRGGGEGGRVSPVLLSARAPLAESLRRIRLLHPEEWPGGPLDPPEPARPLAALVPALAQEEAVLDLSYSSSSTAAAVPGNSQSPRVPSSRLLQLAEAASVLTNDAAVVPNSAEPPAAQASVRNDVIHCPGLGSEVQLRRVPPPLQSTSSARNLTDEEGGNSSRTSIVPSNPSAGEQVTPATISPVVQTPASASVAAGSSSSVTISPVNRPDHPRPFQIFASTDWNLERQSGSSPSAPAVPDDNDDADSPDEHRRKQEMLAAFGRLSSANRLRTALNTLPEASRAAVLRRHPDWEQNPEGGALQDALREVRDMSALTRGGIPPTTPPTHQSSSSASSSTTNASPSKRQRTWTRLRREGSSSSSNPSSSDRPAAVIVLPVQRGTVSATTVPSSPQESHDRHRQLGSSSASNPRPRKRRRPAAASAETMATSNTPAPSTSDQASPQTSTEPRPQGECNSRASSSLRDALMRMNPAAVARDDRVIAAAAAAATEQQQQQQPEEEEELQQHP